MSGQQPDENHCGGFSFANFLSNVVELGFTSPTNINTLAKFITHFTGQQFQRVGHQTFSGNSQDGQINAQCISNTDVKAAECLMVLVIVHTDCTKKYQDQIKYHLSL